MSNRTYKRVFNDEELLKEMLDLRIKGWPVCRLAEKYGADHSSIIYQCNKHIKKKCNVDKSIIFVQEKKSIVKNDKLLLNSEKINIGKSYAEYVEKEKLKKTHKVFKKYEQYPTKT